MRYCPAHEQGSIRFSVLVLLQRVRAGADLLVSTFCSPHGCDPDSGQIVISTKRQRAERSCETPLSEGAWGVEDAVDGPNELLRGTPGPHGGPFNVNGCRFKLRDRDSVDLARRNLPHSPLGSVG